MLTSITPLGEQGRGQRWGLTATFLGLGHLVGGALLGGMLGLLGSGLRSVRVAPSTLVVVLSLAGCAVAAAIADLAGFGFPGRRQVDDTWLTRYRGWVYGFGFGVQLGFGFVTVINTALFAVVVLAGAILPWPTAVALGVCYGVARAVMALLSGRIHTVEQLKALHRRLDDNDHTVAVAGSAFVGSAAIGSAVFALLAL